MASPLQTALAAEYAAAWGYDVVGGKLPTSQQAWARAAQAAHRARATATAAAITAAGETPVGPAATYTLPIAVSGATSAMRLAVRLEDGTAAAWHFVLNADTAHRRLAADALTTCAVTATRWRIRGAQSPATQAFPGT